MNATDLHACGLYLTHNEHLDYYETAEQWLNDRAEHGPTFETPEDRALAISSGNVWQLQWYPKTPVGFNYIAASSFDKLMAYAAKIEAT